MSAKYYSIYTHLLEKIKSGDWGAGKKLPSEEELCKEYDCSKITIKKALDLLVEDGLIERIKGTGTFVKEKKADSRLEEVRMKEGSDLLYGKPEQISNEVLSFTLEFAQGKTAEELEVPEQEPLYHYIRLRRIDGRPYCIEDNFIPCSRVPGLTKEILEHSLFDYIENSLHLKIDGSIRKAQAFPSSEQDQQLLLLKENEPVLELEITTFLADGKPLEHLHSRHRYDMFSLTSVNTHRKNRKG